MGKNVVPTTFVTGPDDKLATVDIYTNAPTTPTNVQKAVESLGIDFGKILPIDAGGLIKDVTNVVQGVTKDIKRANSMFESALPAAKNMLSLSPKSLANSIAAGLGISDLAQNVAEARAALPGLRQAARDVKNEFNSVILAKDQFVEQFNIRNFEDAAALVDIVAAITGDDTLPQLIEVGTQIATFGAILGEAITQEMPSLIESILSGANVGIRDDLVLATVYQAARRGDFLTFYNYYSQVQFGALMATYPDTPYQLVKNYRHPTSAPYATQVNSDEMKSILDHIAPGWAGTNSIGDVGLLIYASRDCRDLLYLQSGLAHLVAASTFFKEISIEQVVRATMPWVPLTGFQRSRVAA